MPENEASAYYDKALIYEEINNNKHALIAYKKSLKYIEKTEIDSRDLINKKIKVLEKSLSSEAL